MSSITEIILILLFCFVFIPVIIGIVTSFMVGATGGYFYLSIFLCCLIFWFIAGLIFYY